MANEKATYFIDLKDKGFVSTLDRADRKLDGFEGHVGRVSGKNGRGGLMGSMAAGFGRLAAAAGTLGLAIGAIGLGKKIITLGVEMEQTRVAFGTMFGTIEEGNKVIARMNEFANVTPFDNAKVLQSAKTLAAFGFEANQLEPTLRLLGDVSSGTGKDLAEMAVVFGQIKSAGRLMGQDLLQLINAGFNPLQEISAKTGRSVMDLKKDMEKGLISFDKVEQAFRDATSEGGKFFNLMEKQSQTVGGRFSTLLGKLQMIGIKLGEAVLPALERILEVTIDIVEMLPKLDFSPYLDNYRDLLRTASDLWDVFSGFFETVGLGTSKLSGFQVVIDTLSLTMRIGMLPIKNMITAYTLFGETIGHVADAAIGLKDILVGGLTFDPGQIAKGIDKLQNAVSTGFNKAKSRIGKLIDEEKDFYSKLFSEREQPEKKDATLSGSGNKGLGKTSADTSSAEGLKTEKVSSGISGSGPKNVTLNINKLIENINFAQYNNQNRQALMDEIKRALLTSLNDTVIAAS